MYNDYHHSIDRNYEQDYHTGYDRFHDPTASTLHYNNETPMYVRPYLEDPIFLQPDDDEVA